MNSPPENLGVLCCPHCRSPIEAISLAGGEEIPCPSCGSSFRLESESTTDLKRLSGQKIGRFELVRTVGHGAFGTVYLARDPKLDRKVAIKVPRAGSLSGQEGHLPHNDRIRGFYIACEL